MSYGATLVEMLILGALCWRGGVSYGRRHPARQAPAVAPQRPPAKARAAQPQAGVSSAQIDAAVSGLVNLGWTRTEARKAVLGQLSAAEGLSGDQAVAALVQAVLRQAGRGKGQRIEPGETS